MGCIKCESTEKTVCLEVMKDGKLESVNVCEKCFYAEMKQRTDENVAAKAFVKPVYTWEECLEYGNREPNQAGLKRVIDIVQASLQGPYIKLGYEDAHNICKNLPVEMYRHLAVNDLQGDMFLSLLVNVLGRIRAHVSKEVLVSELEAAMHDWEILVNLHYKSRVLRENHHKRMEDVVETIKEVGVASIREAIAKVAGEDAEEILGMLFK